jgi:hypothetical protein
MNPTLTEIKDCMDDMVDMLDMGMGVSSKDYNTFIKKHKNLLNVTLCSYDIDIQSATIAILDFFTFESIYDEGENWYWTIQW